MPISQGELDAYDWSWWEAYGADLTAQLIEAYSIAYGTIAGADMTAAHALAVRYAEAHAATLLSGVSDSVQAEIRRLVADTLEQGDSLQTLQRQIRQSYAYSRDHAATIARTETATSLGQGAHQAARDAGKSEKRWYAQLQETTCEECSDNEAAGWIDIDDDFPSGDSTIPVHPNCLPGWQVVTALDVRAAVRRRYDGDIVIIDTAAGKHVAVTPNHPVLTPYGWVAAQSLQLGANVIASRGGRGVALSVDRYQQHVPAAIEDVADTLAVSGRTRRRKVPTAAEDFHGDGTDGEVAIVDTYRPLRRHLVTPRSERLCQRHFVGRYVARSALVGSRSAQQLPLGSASTSRGIVGRGRLSLAFTSGHPGRTQQAGIARPTQDYAVLAQDTADWSASYVVPTRESLERLAGGVAIDQVVQIRRQPFRGHVYNLQTASATYLADGIVTHNCECSVSYRGDWVDAAPRTPVRAAPARGHVEIRCATCRKKLDEAPAAQATKQPRWCRGCRRQVPVVWVQVLG